MSDNKHQRRDDQRPGVCLDWDDTPPAGTTQYVKRGDVPSIEFTLRQAEALVEVFGGHDAEVSVMERPAAWADMDPGLYAYFTEYPDEGSIYLGPTEVDDDLAMHGRPQAAPIRTWRERIGQPPEYPLHAPTDVERAMEAEIADLRATLACASLPAQGGADDLAWNKKALKRHRDKLEAVWEGIREAVQKYTGKPCEGEPFERLDELLRAQHSADAQLDKMWGARFMISQALHNTMVGNQSAWIEWKHGAGAEAAMQWIENGLIGPGLIPSGTEAQAWFDANQDDRYEIPPRPAAAQQGDGS